jgi:hypothetical protein
MLNLAPARENIWTEEELLKAFFNPLQTKLKLLYLKTQAVPRSKHFSPWL